MERQHATVENERAARSRSSARPSLTGLSNGSHHLQRMVGNLWIGMHTHGAGRGREALQPKLTIGAPNDRYEQEADRVADQVVGGHGGSAVLSDGAGAVRRACAACAGGGAPCPKCEEEQVQRMPVAGSITPLVQREADGMEEEEMVQQMPISQGITPLVQREDDSEGEEEEELEEEEEMVQEKNSSGAAPPVTPRQEAMIHSVRGGGATLAPSVRAFMEPRFGHDFSAVRVHTDDRAAESARSIGALAYTIGRDVVFGSGMYNPDTREGKRLLAHELTHVVQQGSAAPSGASAPSHIQRDPAPPPRRRRRRRAPVTPSGPVCGPNVTSQFRAALANMESTFRGWTRANKLRACQRVLIPITPDLRPDINGWDMLPLFQGASDWLRRPPVYNHARRGPCATPTSSDRTNRDPFAAGHEDPNTCSNSVQFDGGCWLNGTVNYGTFGVMVRLCEGAFGSMSALVRSGPLPAEVLMALELAIAVGVIPNSPIEWAEFLIRTYKAVRGSSTDSADLPVAWVRQFYTSGPTASAPAGANRPSCQPTCRYTGSLARWNWVWEPVRPR